MSFRVNGKGRGTHHNQLVTFSRFILLFLKVLHASWCSSLALPYYVYHLSLSVILSTVDTLQIFLPKPFFIVIFPSTTLYYIFTYKGKITKIVKETTKAAKLQFKLSLRLYMKNK